MEPNDTTATSTTSAEAARSVTAILGDMRDLMAKVQEDDYGDTHRDRFSSLVQELREAEPITPLERMRMLSWLTYEAMLEEGIDNDEGSDLMMAAIFMGDAKPLTRPSAAKRGKRGA